MLSTRSLPWRLKLCRAVGQVFVPSTDSFVFRSQVLFDVLIHGPSDCAPPPWKLVLQESSKPTSGDVETFPSPRGMAVSEIGVPAQVTTPDPVPAAVVVEVVVEPEAVEHAANSIEAPPTTSTTEAQPPR